MTSMNQRFTKPNKCMNIYSKGYCQSLAHPLVVLHVLVMMDLYLHSIDVPFGSPPIMCLLTMYT